MDRKELIRKYRDTRPAGVYRVRHRSSGRTMVGASVGVAAMLNRIRAKLGFGSHPSRELQRDWDADGEHGFEFEVLDRLPPSDDPGQDISRDLQALLELWQERLQIETLAYS